MDKRFDHRTFRISVRIGYTNRSLTDYFYTFRVKTPARRAKRRAIERSGLGCWTSLGPDRVNKRRVEQRDASEEQTRRHKQKWQLYESHGRHYDRTNPWTLGDAGPSGAQIEDDARRWKAHLQAVAAGRPGEFTPAVASIAQSEAEAAPAPEPPVAVLRPPFPVPQRPDDLAQIALLHEVGDRVEWYNNCHPNDCLSEPVFGWQPGTVVCTYNVCPMALADGVQNPYHTPGVANYTCDAERQFHFGCTRCTLQKPYAVRLDREEGAGYRGYIGAVQPAQALRVRKFYESEKMRAERACSPG
jgi:hypothetical protein